MRTREEIEKERENLSPVQKDFHDTKISTELLLDIRDLLSQMSQKEKGK